MWKKHGSSLLSLILIIGLILSGFVQPAFVNAAPPATENAIGTGAVIEHNMVFFQNGKEIKQADNPKIDLTTDITATIKDKFKFDKNAASHITANSFVEYELGAPFNLPNGVSGIEEITKPDSAYSSEDIKGKAICKTMFFRDDDGKVKVRFDFSEADTVMFDQNEIEVKATVKLRVDVTKLEAPGGNGKVKILDYELDIDDTKEDLRTEKKAELNIHNGTVDWTVTIDKKILGSINSQLSLTDYVFVDDLTKVGDYKTGSLTINGQTVNPDSYNDKVLRYTIQAGNLLSPNVGKAVIKFSTVISSNEFKYGKYYKNTAELYKNGKLENKTNEAEVTLIPFGKKEGLTSADNKSITWSIVFNEPDANLGTVTVKDKLANSTIGDIAQTRRESYYQVWDENKGDWSETKHNVNPAGIDNDEYTISSVTKKTRLTIVTDDFTLPNYYYEFKNDAIIGWNGESNRVKLSAVARIGRKKTDKSATMFGLAAGETEEEDDRRLDERRDAIIRRVGFETEWIASFVRDNTDNDVYYIYDTFIFDNDIKANRKGVDTDYKITGLNDTVVKTLKSTVPFTDVINKDAQHHHRLVNPSSPLTENKSNIEYEVYAIRNSADKIVGHILELKLDPTKGEAIPNDNRKKTLVKFKSKLVEPRQVMDTRDTSTYNFMNLFKDNGTLIEEAASGIKYNTKMIKKQALSKDAAERFVNNLTVSAGNNIINDDVFDYAAKKAKDNQAVAYNRKDKSIIYRISVNAAGVNDVDGDLGAVTLTDYIPEDFELDKIGGNSDYLIYKGKAATSIAKADATVLAEGSPLSLGTDKLTFTKDETNNKLIFKFAKMDETYVILLKLRIKPAKVDSYLNKRVNIVNKAEITPEKKWIDEDSGNQKKEVKIADTQDVDLNEEFIWKFYDENVAKYAEKGFIKWSIVYRPYKTYTNGKKVSFQDSLSNNIMIRRQKNSSELVFHGDNYRIFEGSVDDNGKFIPTREIKENLSEIFKYEDTGRKFIINLPNGNSVYKITYITDFSSPINSGEGVRNTVALFEDLTKKTIKEPNVSYTVNVSSTGRVWGFDKLTIFKTNQAKDKFLSGAKFELKKEGAQVDGSPKATDAEGKVEFDRISSGEYVLKEVEAPEGYRLNPTEYRIKVTELEVGRMIELLGSYGNVTQDGNELTITNESTYTPGGGGGGFAPPTEGETNPNKPEDPKNPSSQDKPNDPKKPGKPSVPNTPGNQEKPLNPNRPSDPSSPERPSEPGTSEEPEEPNPTPDDNPNPEIPTYTLDNVPDPNDPDSSYEIIVIDDDGYPLGHFVKKTKPDKKKEYVLKDDGTPLSHFIQNRAKRRLPKTGGADNIWYYQLGAGLLLIGAFTYIKRKEEKEI